jgi:5'-nucleotidase
MKSAPLLVTLLVACSHSAGPANDHPGPTTPTAAPDPAGTTAAPAPGAHAVTLSIIGTNDLHGAIERLPLFAGFMANLRAARAADGGGVVLLDGGDMFQGTLESNLGEGADIVRAYNYLGYTAVAVGNHEFDYGPVGPAATPRPGEDARGALKARASEAKFPFVVSNILDEATGARIDWPNMPAGTLAVVAGIKVGVIGASTESTPYTTMPINFVGLKMAPAAAAIAAEASRLRDQGAQVIVATMHIGSNCKDVEHHDDASSCDRSEEIFKVIGGLPRGTVDVIVGGHTHAGMAHKIDGIAVIESYANGRAFGRVDLTIGPDGRVAAAKIDRPHLMCALDKDHNPVPVAQCEPGSYEGKPVVPDPEVQKIVDAAVARAAERRKELLGITVTRTVTRAHAVESAEGNLISDLMLAARPDAQLTMTNGGGLRADLPAGQLTYGQLFEAAPFDNRFAIVDLTGKDLRKMISSNLRHAGGILSFGGLTARARCQGKKLELEIRVGGKPIGDATHYKLATSDFLASGGDGVVGKLKLPDGAVQMTDVIIRDALADVLRGWKGTPRATIDPGKLVSKQAPRLDYEGKRPVSCGGAAPDQEPGE